MNCDMCHKEIVSQGLGTGVAHCPDGRKICYECAAIDAIADMIEHGDTVLYLTGGESSWKITNWPGTLVFKPSYVTKGCHNIAQSRYDAWFIGPDGFEWHGVNLGDNEILRCKRTARKVVLDRWGSVSRKDVKR